MFLIALILVLEYICWVYIPEVKGEKSWDKKLADVFCLAWFGANTQNILAHLRPFCQNQPSQHMTWHERGLQ